MIERCIDTSQDHLDGCAVYLCIRNESRHYHFPEIAVNPQALRHSYRTYLEVVNTPLEVKKTPATHMKYQETTAESSHNLQVKAFKVEPVLKYNEQMAKEYLSNFSESSALSWQLLELNSYLSIQSKV